MWPKRSRLHVRITYYYKERVLLGDLGYYLFVVTIDGK